MNLTEADKRNFVNGYADWFGSPEQRTKFWGNMEENEKLANQWRLYKSELEQMKAVSVKLGSKLCYVVPRSHVDQLNANLATALKKLANQWITGKIGDYTLAITLKQITDGFNGEIEKTKKTIR